MTVRAASSDLVAVRNAVLTALRDVPSGAAVLAGCSGGPDSLALVAALGWVAPRRGLRPHALVVDHGLQHGSADVARWAAGVAERLGVAAARTAVRVGSVGGPEAAARDARRDALATAAAALGSPVVLLGHTLEDQAETVLLRLARGSGARTLAAMAPRARGPQPQAWVRPFLDVPRAVVRRAAVDALEPLGERPWHDPHNDDDRFARVRARRLLDRIEADLGPGAIAGLARSAALLRADADALDDLATDAAQSVLTTTPTEASADVERLLALPEAVRTRVLRIACLAVGCPADALTADHVRAVDALLSAWHGQGPVALPGAVTAQRACGRLCLRPRPDRPGAPCGA